MNFFKVNSHEHRFLPITFSTLTIFGTWYPEDWSTQAKKMYKYFTALLVLLNLVAVVEVLTFIISTLGGENFDLQNMFVLNVFAVGVYKQLCVLRYRSEILKLVSNCSSDKWHKPANAEESIIMNETRSKIRKLTFFYASSIGFAIVLRAIQPNIEAKTLIVLPLSAWYPYKIDSYLTFWLTYFHQVICGVTVSCMHLSNDTLFVSFLLQIIHQLNILKCRIGEISRSNCDENTDNLDEKKKLFAQEALNRCAWIHDRVYSFASDVQQTFDPILIGQIITLIPNLVINVHFLAVYEDRLSLTYFMVFSMSLTPIMQICMACWYGNEVILQSKSIGDSIYKCNWTHLDIRMKKVLLIMMIRQSKSIVISAAGTIPLNNNFFLQVINMSYSAFNLLQHTAAH